MAAMNDIYLSLGSNLGDRMEHLCLAVGQLMQLPVTSVDEVSSVYETTPVGGPKQRDFLNIALRMRTLISPLELLSLCRGIEAAGLRERTQQDGPRTIDVDILLYGDREIETEQLTVPHPRMWERAFVLVPLLEVMEEDSPWRGGVKQALADTGLDGVRFFCPFPRI